ncbi:MAG: imidazolonepropionase, partial [Thermoanaerobaculia bacterium]
MAVLIRNLSQIATPRGVRSVSGAAMRDIVIVEKAAIVIRDGRIAFAGRESEIDDALRAEIDDDVDAGGATAIPGFVDSHTHLPFAGSRESEFNRRLHGESYEEIAATGGGILSTVHATRAASEEELTTIVLARTATMAAHGTTTAEAKSGYGLTTPSELRQLRAIRAASETSPVRLVPTCLAAHEFPPESRNSEAARDRWLSAIVEEVLPAVAEENLALFCDAFVERGVFTRAQGERILRAATAHGMTPRLHADEFSDSDGAALAVELSAASADHLMYVSDAGIKALAQSD